MLSKGHSRAKPGLPYPAHHVNFSQPHPSSSPPPPPSPPSTTLTVYINKHSIMLSYHGSSPGRRSFATYRPREPARHSAEPLTEPPPTPAQLSRSRVRRRRRSVSTGGIPGVDRRRRRRSSSANGLEARVPASPQVESLVCHPDPPAAPVPVCRKVTDHGFRPKAPARLTPTSLEETNALIKAFVTRGATTPLEMTLDDELYASFLQARDEAGHGSCLFRLRYDSPFQTDVY